MKQHSQTIEKENQAIEKILEVVNAFISEVEKPIPHQEEPRHKNWYENKLKEWQILKKTVEALRERTKIWNNKEVLSLLKLT